MISLKQLLKEETKLVYRVNGDASEKFLKRYPKVKQIMYTFVTKNKDIMKGYKAFLKFKDKQEDYLGGRAEQTSSSTFGTKTFYKYDFGGVKGGWPEVYQYLYTLRYGGIDGAVVEGIMNEGNWAKIMTGVRKGSLSGPWTIVIIQNKKVIHQEPVKIKDAIPASYEAMKRKFNNANLAIEDNSGKIVYSEKI